MLGKMKEYGFPKAIRIKSYQDLVGARRFGQHHEADNMTLSVNSRSENDLTKFGINLLRGFKTAVERNRVKRVIREFFRHKKSDFPTGSLVLATAAGNISRLSNSEIRCELESALASYKSNADKTNS
ncbi:MAG: ribonuclease P protein component [candidate division Zixibacteria bacterium CG_4_9_14_3_um_filter_46_8]|nr:MAG: ribonuclease P protein component [candidate division Zixibacteria bacterium CG_4_9_14_3_um_filter_46_8]